ncbi:DNA-processing protein DprA [Weissella confusa]
MKQRDFLLWLLLVPGVGIVGRTHIWQYMIAHGVNELSINEVHQLAGVPVQQRASSRAFCQSDVARSQFEKLKMMDYVTIADDDYPNWLAEIDCPPVVLFYKGNLSFARYPGVAIVGTREMSTYGEQIVKGFVPAFVEAGIITISGLASGIDEAVHRETLAHHGATVGVIGTGLDVSYPRRRDSLQSKVADAGVVVSEYLPWVGPAKHQFPERNRIIAGLCAACLVVEAKNRSGSLITADQALAANRDIYAVPGRTDTTLSSGTNALISAGAIPALSPADIIRNSF